MKIAEGCDRACGFCAIPTFRGPQRSRSIESILGEVDALEVREVVLVAQDLAAYGRDQGEGERAIVPLVEAVAGRVDRVRLLYLYPSDLNDRLVDTICATGVPYFDLSLQHVSPPLMRRMRRWGDGNRFLERIEHIRSVEPEAAFRSNFIVGYPGETEEDHDALLDFVAAADRYFRNIILRIEHQFENASVQASRRRQHDAIFKSRKTELCEAIRLLRFPIRLIPAAPNPIADSLQP